MLVPYSNVTVVEKPFALMVALTVAVFSPMLVAAFEVTVFASVAVGPHHLERLA